MSHKHAYNLTLTWTGNQGSGTTNYQSYSRNHKVTVEGKPDLLCSADPGFRGDKTKYNPEELLLASLSGCHMLWFLHLCADDGIHVVDYTDHAIGTMTVEANGSGHFSEVTLHPRVIVTKASMVDRAHALHKQANKYCFIANSVNFPVHHEAVEGVRGIEV